MPFQNVTRENPCQICGKEDWCREDPQTGVIECHRVEEGSIQETDGGFFIHLKDANRQYEAPVITQKGRSKAGIGQLNLVYTALINQSVLTTAHREHLLQRGITEAEISILNYRSMPIDKKARVLANLKKEFGDKILAQVPGFCVINDVVVRLLGTSGILLPCLDIKGRIQGFQLRYDAEKTYRWLSSQECSSGSPIHITAVGAGSKELWITEGILKADIAALKLSARFIGIAGVNAWMKQRDQLKDLIKQLKVESVIIAFDADADENPIVEKAVRELAVFLDEIVDVQIALWDPALGKGIDDLLVAGKTPIIHDLKDAPDVIERQIEKMKALDEKQRMNLMSTLIKKVITCEPIRQGYYINLMKKAGFGTLSDLRAQVKLFQKEAKEEADSPKTLPTIKDEPDFATEQQVIYRTYRSEGGGIDNKPVNSLAEEVNTALINGQKGVLYRNQANNLYLQVDPVAITASPVSEAEFASLTREMVMTRTERVIKTESSMVIHDKADQYVPLWLIQQIYHHKLLLSQHPVLNGVVNHPVMTREGVISQNGYHQRSGYLLKDSPDFDFDAIETTQEAIEEAKRWLYDEMLDEFLFSSDSDLANYLAYLLTFAVRPYINGHVPLFIITAPVRGSGKTFAIQVAHLLWIGKEKVLTQASSNQRGDDDEMRKRLTSILRSTPESVVFDNVDTDVNNSSLALVLTAESFQDRELGKNHMIEVEVRSIMSMTGNNITIEKDMPRRVYISKLEADREKPDFRRFKRPDLKAWILENRLQLMQACFTFVKVWIEAGKPRDNEIVWGSYDEWAKTIGGILKANQIEGFLRNRDQIEGEDTLAFREFCKAVYNEHGEEAFTVSDIFTIASYHSEDPDEGQNILGDWLGSGNDHSRRSRLGKLMSKNNERFFDDLRLMKLEGRRAGNKLLFTLRKSSDINDTVPFDIPDENESTENTDFNLDQFIFEILPADYMDIHKKLDTAGHNIILENLLAHLADMVHDGKIMYDGNHYELS